MLIPDEQDRLAIKSCDVAASETLMQAHRRAHAPRKEGASQETKEAAGKGGGRVCSEEYWEVSPLLLHLGGWISGWWMVFDFVDGGMEGGRGCEWDDAGLWYLIPFSVF